MDGQDSGNLQQSDHEDRIGGFFLSSCRAYAACQIRAVGTTFQLSLLRVERGLSGLERVPSSQSVLLH